MEEDDGQQRKIAGVVKWFDGSKGFGFLTDPDGGADILLHANVLRNFGQSSVAEGSHVIAIIQKTPRGMQAVEVLEITPPASEPMPAIADLCSATPEEIAQLPLLPARVKWFDKAKGFGFANIFADKADVFLHVEVLRHSGFADLAVGEAIALRVVDGRRGMMAAQILSWERAAIEARQSQPGGAAALAKLRLVAGAV
ncbi:MULTISPECIES: cold-shock protein [Paracoccus]|jgi:CspA family cold shock protein|uniref:Cold-shock DNA-binding protein family n=1 Tax=Paracoccus denitrificans (strain Pd 1222) TaxID=318586 RepID=A1B0C7_PARDP|nr:MULTISPECIES: cold shock domain-containing protein [Paracoccus]ABL68971.1 cold-shock DNA-binding protein family [Paracoccus denitrificans PD1222]MBB4625303.1 CspA family cold shock protein [Paracoccus denitrificans]MCU7428129.1 cold shock domain-containing protein [Paracoccus denitrificans]QAR27010.1 cold shock domain-containing protein [Paracoccus denitrificans]UFS64358.1 cold shock domain-containing protein [Paracoccus denitrificans]